MPSVPFPLCEDSVFSRVFLEYADTLHNYLYYKTGDQAMAQDLTQEAFTRLWKNCEGVDESKAKGYVFRTANNLLLNTYEHQKVKLKFKQRIRNQEDAESPEYLLEEKELKEALEDAISALPEKQRVVFLMSRIEKQTYKEIATALGISRQAVEKRMYNALSTLRKISQQIR